MSSPIANRNSKNDLSSKHQHRLLFRQFKAAAKNPIASHTPQSSTPQSSPVSKKRPSTPTTDPPHKLQKLAHYDSELPDGFFDTPLPTEFFDSAVEHSSETVDDPRDVPPLRELIDPGEVPDLDLILKQAQLDHLPNSLSLEKAHVPHQGILSDDEDPPVYPLVADATSDLADRVLTLRSLRDSVLHATESGVEDEPGCDSSHSPTPSVDSDADDSDDWNWRSRDTC